jgi:GT2 family glycosyltransferase
MPTGNIRDAENLSNGFVPLAPLLHPDPTAVGVWDLTSPAGIRYLDPGSAQARDQLVLVRLHGEPVGMIHLPEPPGAGTRAEMLASTWGNASTAIVSHIRRYSCMSVPATPAELDGSLDQAHSACPCQTSTLPPGSAAVILCTVGREAELARCLESLTRLRGDSFEVIVVDNRPAVSVTKALAERYASKLNLRYVAEPRMGISKARNAGIRASGATYLAFVDDDVVVDEDWLLRMLAPFRDESVHAVTGLVVPLKLPTHVEKLFERYAGFGKGVEPEFYDMSEHRSERFLYPYFGGVFGSGNSMAFRRDALLRIGGFDEIFGAGTLIESGEDIAAFSDVVLAGGRIAYEPKALCWHEHRSDQAALERQVHSYGIGLTAVFTRYLMTDWRFTATLLRTVPLTIGILAKRRRHRGEELVPVDLVRLEAQARRFGPWRYVVSRARMKAGVGRAGQDHA